MSNPLSNRFLVLLYLFLISISASFLPTTASPSLNPVSIAPSSTELENRRIHSERAMEERIGQSVGVGGSFGRIRGNDLLGRAGMGYNNPLSDGGSMLTVSFFHFHFLLFFGKIWIGKWFGGGAGVECDKSINNPFSDVLVLLFLLSLVLHLLIPRSLVSFLSILISIFDKRYQTRFTTSL